MLFYLEFVKSQFRNQNFILKEHLFENSHWEEKDKLYYGKIFFLNVAYIR